MSSPWKACDIRGIFPDEVSPDLLRRVGSSVGSLLPMGARVLVAGDHRISTPQLKAALAEGLLGGGSQVLDAGQIPTPIAYFAHQYWSTDAVMIVTASHNPPDHNGLKMMIGTLPPTPEDFHRLRARVEEGGFRQHLGGVETVDPLPAYKAHVLERWKHLGRSEGLPVVLDAGNGAWSELAPDLFAALGFRAHTLFCKIDGSFPSRSPDCSRPGNLRDLRNEVPRTGALLGIAWDGDGDRVAFVDDAGSVLTADEVSALMVREMVPREPGAKVIYDLKLAELVPRIVRDCHGVPVMERSGHAFIKRAMLGHNALLGCEVSGHYFFRELMGGDDGLFASLFMAEVLASHGLPLSKLRQTLPPVFATPDLRIPSALVSYGEIVQRLCSKFPGAKAITLDGTRLETEVGIMLVRKSVTEAVVTMRLEGRTKDSFRELLDMVLNALPEAARNITKQIDQSEGGTMVSDLRAELVKYARRVLEEKLATGAGGNISARLENVMLISPSGFSLEDVSPNQYVEVNILTGEVAPDALRPSSEVLMHLACYRQRPDVRAVIHTHAPFTMALTSSGHDLKPMFADSIIYLGRNVPHIDYITVTTPELAEAVARLIPGCACVILRNHGAITVGENLKQAFWRACSVEESARVQFLATLVGTPKFLDAAEADRLESLASEQSRRQLFARMKEFQVLVGGDDRDRK